MHIIKQITNFPVCQLRQNPLSLKSQAQSIRFGEVQKFKSSNSLSVSSYTFILPIKQSFQMIKVQCPVVSTYSDNLSLKIPILGSKQTVRMDNRNAPIIDMHDQSDLQIMHKFTINEKNLHLNYSVKVYPYNNYHDPIFKAGIYEAYLYNQLALYNKSRNSLKEMFLIQKGTPNALVFVFTPFMYTLQDVLIYRKSALIPYTAQEQCYIIAQLLNNYKALFINDIFHRDIRPSKIYLSQCSRKDNDYVGSSAFQGYQFQNLQSARKMTKTQSIAKNSGKKQMLMTIKGVPLYCSKQVSQIHERKQQMGLYDPEYNDRIGLAKTIASILTLDVHSAQINHSIFKQNKKISDLITGLQNMSIPFFQVCRKFQNQKNDTMKASNGIVESDFNICQNYLPKLLKEAHAQRIQTTSTQLLFLMHLRDLFTHRFDKMMTENYKSNNISDNVPILQRMGKYYQGIGLRQNDYYVQEIDLLLHLSQEERLRCYYNSQALGQANKLTAQKFDGNLKKQSGVILQVQNAYNLLANNNIDSAIRNINKALQIGGSSSQLSTDKQIKIIKAKGIIQSQANGPDAGDVYLERGLDLSKNRNNFTTQIQMLQEKSDFQYLLAKNILKRNSQTHNQIPSNFKTKQLTKCQSYLLSAKQIKSQIPMKNTLPFANVYQALGDLSILRQDYDGAGKNYEKCYRLIQSSQFEINEKQKIRILEKMYGFYIKHSQNFIQQQIIKKELEAINKKNIKNSTRDNRKQFQRIRYLKMKNSQQISNKQFKQPAIIEAEQNQQDQRSKKF